MSSVWNDKLLIFVWTEENLRRELRERYATFKSLNDAVPSAVLRDGIPGLARITEPGTRSKTLWKKAVECLNWQQLSPRTLIDCIEESRLSYQSAQRKKRRQCREDAKLTEALVKWEENHPEDRSPDPFYVADSKEEKKKPESKPPQLSMKDALERYSSHFHPSSSSSLPMPVPDEDADDDVVEIRKDEKKKPLSLDEKVMALIDDMPDVEWWKDEPRPESHKRKLDEAEEKKNPSAISEEPLSAVAKRVKQGSESASMDSDTEWMMHSLYGHDDQEDPRPMSSSSSSSANAGPLPPWLLGNVVSNDIEERKEEPPVVAGTVSVATKLWRKMFAFARGGVDNGEDDYSQMQVNESTFDGVRQFIAANIGPNDDEDLEPFSSKLSCIGKPVMVIA
jgi:hypothetical protein